MTRARIVYKDRDGKQQCVGLEFSGTTKAQAQKEFCRIYKIRKSDIISVDVFGKDIDSIWDTENKG